MKIARQATRPRPAAIREIKPFEPIDTMIRPSVEALARLLVIILRWCLIAAVVLFCLGIMAVGVVVFGEIILVFIASIIGALGLTISLMPEVQHAGPVLLVVAGALCVGLAGKFFAARASRPIQRTKDMLDQAELNSGNATPHVSNHPEEVL